MLAETLTEHQSLLGGSQRNPTACRLLYVQLAMFAVWLLSFTVFTKLFQVKVPGQATESSCIAGNGVAHNPSWLCRTSTCAPAWLLHVVVYAGHYEGPAALL